MGNRESQAFHLLKSILGGDAYDTGKVAILSVYEALSLMINFGILLLGLLTTYANFHRSETSVP
ncbi:putative holin-like toxin [Streptococcus sp. S784/96/1]|uniref:putative holin-like toxin n=1 Tax=Streptococcus sp. S784/96/1 TaxID=2653499 RepID=UPI0013895A5B|nr:putative holin-like toxin [Streptococcus sp. S784/96/1]